jgi:aspartyl aminopeptidase
MIRILTTVVIVLNLILVAAGLNAEPRPCQDNLDCKSSWLYLSDNQKRTVFDHAEDYKKFMDKARTELSFVEEAVKLVKNHGFNQLKEDSALRAGAKYYDVNRDRALSLIVIGKSDLKEGLNVVGAHIDSPRLELKARPLYEKENFALFQTNYHGGIKNYQWTNIPLALVGRVDKKDGSTIQINIGMDDDDPIFMIPDVSPHTDRGFGEEKANELVKKEDLDPIIAHISGEEEGSIQDQVLSILKERYDISRADLVSAELSLVPTFKSRDMGFDRSMIAAYGQDDRLSAYAALRAITEINTPRKTALAYLVDNEEVGNVNNTGAKSRYFTNLIARLLLLESEEDYRDTTLGLTLRNSRMISIDVNPAVNPKKPDGWELNNAPRLGFGVNLKMYGRGFNANSEFTALIRNILDENEIPWQTATYKVGEAGGGTIGGEFSRLNMEVIDFGVPVLSIHTPYAVSSKVDVYHLFKASQAFFLH